jgi:serine/threonine protein kinase
VEIILEFMPGGSLRSLLDKFGRFDEKLVQIYLKQILEGLRFLHCNGIIHRDIKCANILVSGDG